MRATRLQRHLTFFCAIFCATTFISRAIADDLTDQDPLIDFFSSTCANTTGEWTQAALKRADDLKSVLIEIAQDPDCQTFSANLSSVSAITSSLNTLNLEASSNASESNLLSSEYAVLSSLTSSTDSTVSKQLKSLLTSIDTRLTSTVALDKLQVRASAASNLVTATQGIIDQAMNNQTCLLSKPKVLASVGALAASVGAAVTVINPVVGLATAGAGSLISGLVSLGQKSNLSKAVHKLSDSAIKPQAFSCVMESLTDDYCRAEDALAIIDWQTAHASRSSFPVTSPLYGLGLLDHEIPIFMDWLISLKGGNYAQNHYDSEKISDFNNEKQLFESSKAEVQGIIGESTANIDAADPASKWPLVRNLVDSIVSKLNGPTNYSGAPTVSNPMFKQYLPNEAKFLLIGISRSQIPPANSTSTTPVSFDDYFPSGPIPSLQNIQTNFDNWYKQTGKLVATDQAIALQPDASHLLQNALDMKQRFDQKYSVNSVSNHSTDMKPYQALINILAYLENQKIQNPTSNESIHYLPDTIKTLKSIKTNLDLTLQTDKPDYHQILSDIYEEAQLDFGSVFIQDRLNSHIENAIVRYLENPVNSSDNGSILAQTLASKRMTDLLTHFDSTKIAAVRTDIDGSTIVVQPIFLYFLDTFQAELTKSLRYYLKQEQAIYVNQPKAVASYHRARAKMCLLISEAPQWPRKIPYYELCDGTSTDRLPGGPVSPTLSMDFINGPHSCTYYRLKQDTLIYSTRMNYAQ